MQELRRRRRWRSAAAGGGGGFGGGGGRGRRRRRRLREAETSESTAESAASASKPIVKLVDVVKTYVMGHNTGGGGLLRRRSQAATTVTVHALRGVSVDFYPGEYIAIMGASGSGKSTMLNLLGCLDRPTSGEYFLGGRDVAQLDDDELSEIRSRYLGFIFQSYNLIQQYTVLENIQLPLTYQGTGEIIPRPQERTVEVARLVGLGDRLDHRPIAALRRPAAARRHRPVADQRPLHHPGRRGDRQPRHQDQPRNHGDARQAQRRGQDHHHGHPRRRHRRARQADHPDAGRPDHRRRPQPADGGAGRAWPARRT